MGCDGLGVGTVGAQSIAEPQATNMSPTPVGPVATDRLVRRGWTRGCSDSSRGDSTRLPTMWVSPTLN